MQIRDDEGGHGAHTSGRRMALVWFKEIGRTARTPADDEGRAIADDGVSDNLAQHISAHGGAHGGTRTHTTSV